MKKKWYLLLILIILIIIFILFLPKDDSTIPSSVENNKPVINNQFEKLELDWNEIYTLEISGNEGSTILSAKQGEIPEFEERKEKARELLSEKDMVEVRKMEDRDFCVASSDTSALKNGDKVVYECDTKALSMLGYSAPDQMIYNVEGLEAEAVIPTEEPKEEKPEKVEVTDRVVKGETGYSNDGTENVYWYYGDFVMISPSDIDKVNTDNLEKVDYVVITAESLFEKDKIIERVNEGEISVDQILFEGNVYYKEDNFKEGEPWKGIAIG